MTSNAVSAPERLDVVRAEEGDRVFRDHLDKELAILQLAEPR